jgi:hypothetical protein
MRRRRKSTLNDHDLRDPARAHDERDGDRKPQAQAAERRAE